MTVARRPNVQMVAPSGADHRAAALEQDDVPPAAERVLPDPPLDADAPNPTRSWRARLGGVLGEDAGEQRPQAGRLGRRDERLEERPTDAAAARLGRRRTRSPRRRRDTPVAPSRRSAPSSPGSARPARRGRRTGSRRDASGRSDASRAPRARARRRRSRCPRRRCAGPSGQSAAVIVSIRIAIARMMLRAGAIGRTGARQPGRATIGVRSAPRRSTRSTTSSPGSRYRPSVASRTSSRQPVPTVPLPMRSPGRRRASADARASISPNENWASDQRPATRLRAVDLGRHRQVVAGPGPRVRQLVRGHQPWPERAREVLALGRAEPDGGLLALEVAGRPVVEDRVAADRLLRPLGRQVERRRVHQRGDLQLVVELVRRGRATRPARPARGSPTRC